MSDAARIAYIFQCQGEDLYAVSHDITAANIPRSSCSQGWLYCEEFELDDHRADAVWGAIERGRNG